MTQLTKFLSLFSLVLIMTACAHHSPVKTEIADRVASPAWMVERHVAAEPFLLTAYERMHETSAPANIYIEGDGEAWTTRLSQSPDPTPVNPVGLHIASRDKAQNVAYLARPCQYTKMLDSATECNAAYWGDLRFSPEVIESYNRALNDIKARYGITEFNIVGFSGGATVAAILAAQRDDVVTLRTVAGNLDHRALSAHHNVSYLDGSLNPPAFAADLANIPQMHFIGGQDDVIPPGVLHSYLQALGNDNCTGYQLVQEASHTEGWVNKWPQLLGQIPVCRAPIEEKFDMPVVEEPIFTPRLTPSKP